MHSKFILIIILLLCFHIIKNIIKQKYCKSIFYKEKFDSYIVAFNKSKNFINTNLKGELLLDKKNYQLEYPKISVIIPCHNCKNYILRAVRSIQNQDFLNIEIIIVNDFSNDGTLLYIESIKKEDPRIIIINNKKNYGTLYSRSIGTLSSKGNYLFPVDSDDMILNFNVFSIIYKIAEKNDFDIIIFNSILTNLKPNLDSTKIQQYSRDKYHKPNLVLFQPDLGFYPIAPTKSGRGFIFNEVIIFAKCIKSSIYKKAINKLRKNRFSRFMILGEDEIANNIIFNTAKSAKFIPFYGYLHIIRKGSVSRRGINLENRFLNYLYILDVMIDFSQNIVKNKIILFKYLRFLFRYKNLKTFLYSSDHINKTFISCLDRILNCKYISSENKIELRTIGKSMKFINYNF